MALRLSQIKGIFTQLARVEKLFIFPITVVSILSVFFTFFAAMYYQKLGDNDYGTNTDKVSTAMYFMGAFQCLLIIVLAVRGMFDGLSGLFKAHTIQAVILLHTLFSSTLITALWVARMMIEAMVISAPMTDMMDAVGTLDKGYSGDSNLKASYIFHTLSTVFSNTFTACVLAVIVTNTMEFHHANLSKNAQEADVSSGA